MSAKWNRSSDVVWEKLDGDALVVRPETGARWSLNATAAAIWELCDGTRSLAEMSAHLAKLSGRCEQKLAEEIGAFCAAFARLGLLRSSAPSTLQLAGLSNASYRTGLNVPPMFQSLGAGHGTRRRPGPGGVSGPV